MGATKPFKVIIVGGGVAGLTLANMFEKFAIDFVVLEGHKDIAPPVGASIGLFPNGLLILDQLGCYEAVQKVSQVGNYESSHIRGPDGKSINRAEGFVQQHEKRHGYPMLFFDRQALLQVLYDQVQNKDKILTQKKVTCINTRASGVEVTTDDGKTIHGSMIIGADGIHSTIRREMRRLADQTAPGYFPPGEEESVPCFYQCSFGIAQNVEKWVDGEQAFTCGDKKSFLVASGPENRCYWFLFVKLPKVIRGKDIPRYTKKDEEQFMAEHRNLPITDCLTFAEVYDKRLTSTLTPLHEVVFKKWFFDRIVLIGDSVHKPNPIGGMGGNGAMETAAELLNALLEVSGKNPGGLNALESSDYAKIFGQMQSARFDRATNIVNRAHAMQALFARENPALTNVVFNVLPRLSGEDNSLRMTAESIVGASRLKYAPVPNRPRVIPFDCELPSKPMSPASQKPLRALFIAAMIIILFVTAKAFRIPFDKLGNWAAMLSLQRHWLGDGPLNNLLNGMVSIISYPLAANDPESRVHLMYFLAQLISPLLIYTIEGYRCGNQGTLLALPFIFTAGMQVQGIGRIAPLYGILNALQSREDPGGRSVRPAVARALLPALILGYVMPTVMMFAPTSNTANWQDWMALWQAAPVLFSLFTFIFSFALGQWQKLVGPVEKKGDKEAEERRMFERYEDKDVPILKSVYTYAFWTQATVHICVFAYTFFHPHLSFSTLFWNLPNPMEMEWTITDVSILAKVFFQYDMVTALAAIVMFNVYTLFNLRRQGMITTFTALKAVMAVLLGQLLVGPGATWSGLWYWREGIISGLSTYNTV